MPIAELMDALGSENLNTMGTPVTYGKLRHGLDLGAMASRHERGELFAEYSGTARVFGRDLLVFKVGEARERISNVFYVDPEKGFLPLKVEFFDPSGSPLLATGFMTDIEKCSRGRWFPKRSVLVFNTGAAKNEMVGYREFKVTAFDTESLLDDKEFSIVIPKGYQLQLRDDNYALLRTGKEETLYLRDLARLLAGLKESSEKWRRHEEQAAAKARAKAKGNLWVLFVGVPVAALVAGSYLRRRFRRGSVSTPPTSNASGPHV
jgi:hypothetical protein